MQPEVLEQLDRAVEQAGAFSLSGLILGLLFSVGVAAVFSTAGGLIGGAVFKVEQPAPPAPPSAPYAPPPPPADFGGDGPASPPPASMG